MMRNVFYRSSLLFALAVGVLPIGIGSIADAGGLHYRNGCQPVMHHRVQYQPMTYQSVPCQTATYQSVPCQTATYQSLPCHQTVNYPRVPYQTVTYRSVPCPPVHFVPPPCASSGPPTEPTPQEPPPSGILLEVVDLVDPLEVGALGTYVITVTNQGEIVAIDNIEIIVTLPEQLEYVSSNGPTTGSAEGQVIRFAPFETLYAGEEVVYRLMARSVGVGDIRFQVELMTDQSPEPITETESTNLYE